MDNNYSSDEEDNENIDEIFDDEENILDSDKINNTYYIGSYFLSNNKVLMACTITPQSFFKYNINDVQHFLYSYSISPNTNLNVNIMKLHIENEYYTVSLKTHWLCIIQRHVKKIYNERKKIINMRMTMNCIQYCEKHGNYPQNCRVLPRIRGMLSIYSKKN